MNNCIKVDIAKAHMIKKFKEIPECQNIIYG